MLWKTAFVELLLPDAINVNARSSECGGMAASPQALCCAADRDPVAPEPLLCMAAAALPAHAVLTHSGVLKFFLSSSLVFQVYPRRISDLSVCLSFFLPPSSLS